MDVHLGSDHAGLDLKLLLMDQLSGPGIAIIDHGAFQLDPEDDYPAFCLATARAVATDAGSLGVVIGGSGNGEQIAANKVRGIRAALVWSQDTARLARQHNDANVMAIGARLHTRQEAVALVRLFLETPFSGDPRHMRRIAQVSEIEEVASWT